MPSPWLLLGLSGFVAGAALVFATVRGLAVFRAAKRLLRETGEAASALGRSAAEIESRLEAGAGGSDELATALGRLRVSRARLYVLLGALRDVRDSAGRVTAFVPRK
ncbi:MAG: hypothetical protein HY511_09670 [Actinobacteria bacterium]|nr:hypothetical protein [Actinomycetota bacterium]